MPNPGDIIQEAEIIKHKLLGPYWFTSDDGDGYIDPDYAGTIKRKKDGKEVIRNLVCLGEDRFAACNYEKELIQIFYTPKGKICDDVSDTWLPRWKESAEKPQTVSCQNPKNISELPACSNYRTWRFARVQKWITPVLNSEHMESIEGNRRFCPAPLNNIPYELPVFYVPELHCKDISLPLQYQGTFDSALLKKGKTVKIYIHGTLDPLKWHYGIWNHMLSGTINSEPKEKQMWESWLKQSLPDSQEVSRIFGNCKAVKKKGGGNCISCPISHFQKIHSAIRHLSNIYWQKCVTFWESSATKQVDITPTPSGFYEITIIVSAKTEVKVNHSMLKKYPFLLLKGWSYDFDYSDRESIFHLDMVTCYFKNTNPFNMNNTVIPQSELKNVTRL